MRVAVVEPGPNFSVQDVYRGWVAGLKAAGATVAGINLSDRLNFYERALVDVDGTTRKALPRPEDAVRLANRSLYADLYTFNPDLIVIVSGFYINAEAFPLARARGHKIAVVCTESPYEDSEQIGLASRADVILLNDPTNLDAFRKVNPHTYYVPHAYDPARHRPIPPDPDLLCDFGWVGTLFPSRLAFFAAVDWAGLDVKMAGNFDIARGTSLEPFVQHPLDECVENSEAVRLYASAKASANLYRKEASRDGDDAGWSMGPREVELAACGTFFLRESRPEGDELLSMLPVFDGPDDFAAQLRWWLAHDEQREAAAGKARAAIAPRTFEAHAADLLRLVERL